MTGEDNDAWGHPDLAPPFAGEGTPQPSQRDPMTRQKPRRQPPPPARLRRDMVSPAVAVAYRAELVRRMDRLRDIVHDKCRDAGWVEGTDGVWTPPTP